MLKIASIIKTKLTSSLVVLSMLLLMTACGQLAELDSHSTVSRFQKAEDLYKASMRWGEWPTLFHLIKPRPEQATQITSIENNKQEKLQPPSEALLTHLDTIKVSSIDVLSDTMNEKSGTAKTRFQIDYYREDSTKIHTFRHTVMWWYDKEGNNWFSDTPLPKEFALPEHPTIKLSPKTKY